MPFPYSPKSFYYRKLYGRLKYEDAWCHLATKLASAKGVKSITFVLPDEFHFFDSWYNRKVMGAFGILFTAKPFLNLEIVRMMRDEESTDDMPKSTAEWVARLANLGKYRVRLATAQLDGRWSLTGQSCVNKHGRLAVVEGVEWTEANTEIIEDARYLFG